MKKWTKNCYSFERVRELCRQSEESVDICKKIMAALVTSCNELIPPDPDLWIYGDAFARLRDDILEEMELMCSEDEYEKCEDTVNHCLIKTSISIAENKLNFTIFVYKCPICFINISTIVNYFKHSCLLIKVLFYYQ